MIIIMDLIMRKKGLFCIILIRRLGLKNRVFYEAYKGADLYVFRYQNFNGVWVLKNSKPCCDCTRLIKKSKIRKVYYSGVLNESIGIISIRSTKLNNTHIANARSNKKAKDNKNIRKLNY
jgi:hypothetical protein